MYIITHQIGPVIKESQRQQKIQSLQNVGDVGYFHKFFAIELRNQGEHSLAIEAGMTSH